MVPLAFLLLLGVRAAVALSPSCAGNSNCKCVRQQPNSYQLTCSKPTLTVDHQPGNSFRIQCKEPDESDFSMLKGLNIGPVKSFALRYCPFPNTTLKELMKTMQVTEVTEIDLKPNFEVRDGLPPNLFEGLESVTQIHLNSIGLTSLPEHLFDGVPKLVSVVLSGNYLKSIPRRHLFCKTPQLEVIELSSNQLASLEPGVFNNLSHLRVLSLEGNRLENLSRSIFKDVPNLEELDLRSNGLKTLPHDVFADLAKLSTLNLNHNNFTHLPSGLFKGTLSLETLELNINGELLRTLPNGLLSHLPVLRRVSVTQCGLSTVPEDLFWNSPNVSWVSLEGNQLRELPEALFRDARELKWVDFSYNQLESLPDHLFSSTSKLKTLKLLYNNIHTLSSQTFRGLSQLEILNLENNKLSYIGKEAFATLKSLTVINLTTNNLTFSDSTDAKFGPLKSPLQYCQRLEHVKIANNDVEHIFEDWRLLPSLRVLDLGFNRIKKITTEDFLFASNRVILAVNDNDITTVSLRDIEPSTLNLTRTNAAKGIRVDIGDNPIVCDCSIRDLVRYNEGALAPAVHSFLEIHMEVTKCAGPGPMEHVEVTKLNSKVLNCPDQVADSSKAGHAH